MAAVRLEIGVEPPDQGAHALPGRRGWPIGERIELVDQPLGVHPAQAVRADGELAGVVADDHRVGQQPVRLTLPHSAPSVAIRPGSGVT